MELEELGRSDTCPVAGNNIRCDCCDDCNVCRVGLCTICQDKVLFKKSLSLHNVIHDSDLFLSEVVYTYAKMFYHSSARVFKLVFDSEVEKL